MVIASLLLMSLYIISPTKSETENPTGKITIGNTAPTDPSVFGVQDTSSATLMDTSTPDTHMVYSDSFNMSWTQSTDANGDTITYKLCIASTSGKRTAGDCDIKLYSGTNAYYVTTGSDTGLTYSGASVTYYVRINATDGIDGSGNYDTDFAILNSAPTCVPVTGLTFGTDGGGQTHQTTVAGISNAKIDWADCTDADTAGTADHYPADSLVYTLKIGDSASGGTERTSDSNLGDSEKSSPYTVADLIFGSSLTNTIWVNKTYYYQITADDQQGTSNSVSGNADGDFVLFNRVPSLASAWNTAETHNPQPSVSYTGGTDTDGDSVTCHITAGNAGNYQAIISEADAKTGVSSATFWDKTIPWNATETVAGGWSNYTASMRIWCVDDKTPTLWYNSNSNYTTTMVLYDNLPDITTIELSDAGGTYSDCAGSICAINPVEGTNATIAVRVTFTDTDLDCTTGHNVYAHFCYNSTAGQACSETANNVSYQVNSISGASTTCTAVFTTNKTVTDNTPQFWMDDNTYKIYVNATSQSAVKRASDDQQSETWLYNKLRSISYPSTLFLGDATIDFYQWNTNTTVNDAINIGNHPLKLNWNASNPTCSPESSGTCGTDAWTLNATDFAIDDDTSPTDDTGNQVFAYINSALNPQFDHLNSGLLNCDIYTCATPANATLATYFHIAPPSLRAGTYNSTFIITLADFS